MTTSPKGGHAFRLSRRAFLGNAAGLAGVGASAQLPLLAAAPRRAWGQSAEGTVSGPVPADDAGARLVLLGTQGGPTVNLRRSQTASVIVVEGRPYLVDCGYGALRSLVESGIGYLNVWNVFLTHLHDDHTLDLAALLSLQWTGRRREPTNVYGPHGTAALVTGALAFVRGNVEIRTIDEGRTVRPEALFRGHDIPASGDPREAFADERIRVRVIENTHFPDHSKAQMAHRSLAYRFEAAGRSFVFSGDTAYSENLIELARNAEIFVCEAMDVAQHERLSAQLRAAEAAGDPNAALLRHVAETHVTTEQVGRMAAEAGVGTVVLNHLLPGSNAPVDREVPDTTYIAGVRKFFDGPVIVGRDLMRL